MYNIISDNSVAPLLNEYNDVKNLIKQKAAEKTELSQKKKNTGFFNPIRHIQLNQQLTTLTEEIEELKNQKSTLLIHLGCTKENDTKTVATNLQKMNDTVEKLSERQEILEQQKMEQTMKFHEWKSKVSPEKEMALLDERISLRENHRKSLISKLQKVFGKVFSYECLRDVSDDVDYHLNENPYIISRRALEKQYEHAQEKSLRQPAKTKKRSREMER